MMNEGSGWPSLILATPSNTLVMRQGQNNKRSRGRPNNRKSQSGRTFDSNGPDVKIRGTAAHIYEKYQSLARDAQASGDRIIAENYLQHAEHYFRMMLAAEGPAGIQNRMNQMQARSAVPGGPNGQSGDGEEATGQEAVSSAGNGANGQQPRVDNRENDDGRPQASDKSDEASGPAGADSANGPGEASVAASAGESPSPNGAADDHAGNGAAAPPGDGQGDGAEAPAAAAGDGRGAPKRRGRPPRARAEAPATPAAEPSEAGSKTSEPAS